MTAFVTPRGLRHFLRMPQGHDGAPGAFVRLMQIVIAGLHSVRMYLDDAIVFDETAELHV